jgi:toxin ParE1/3/4
LNLSKYQIRPEAQRDLESFAKYLTREAGEDLGERFLDSARESFTALGGTPQMGPLAHSRNSALAGLRKWRIAGFPNYLIFYLPLPDGADILRVVHGAQDWWRSLDIATDES